MTPFDFQHKVKKELSNADKEAVAIFSDAVEKLEEKILKYNRTNTNLEYVSVYLDYRQLCTKDPLVLPLIVEMLEQYLTNQDWLVCIQKDISFPNTSDIKIHMYTNTRKHRFYAWFRNTFNSQKDLTGWY